MGWIPGPSWLITTLLKLSRLSSRKMNAGPVSLGSVRSDGCGQRSE